MLNLSFRTLAVWLLGIFFFAAPAYANPEHSVLVAYDSSKPACLAQYQKFVEEIKLSQKYGEFDKISNFPGQFLYYDFANPQHKYHLEKLGFSSEEHPRFAIVETKENIPSEAHFTILIRDPGIAMVILIEHFDPDFFSDFESP